MDDETVWQRFLHELLTFRNLRSVHFLGGEPTLSPRLEQFLDFFINNNKTDFAISFVTNGTKFCPDLIDKMKKFTRADIDISIESVLDNNYYLRQGLKKDLYTSNVQKFLDAQSDNFFVCLKPVISALTIPTFPELIEYFLDNDIFTESNICYDPAHFQVAVLPMEIRQTYFEKYERVLKKIASKQNFKHTNLIQPRFKDTLANSLYNELETAFNMVKQPEPDNAESLQKEMVWWLSKWDKDFNLNAKDYYPEWSKFLDKYSYYA
jgi:sulfatase maturation enzyme AslB (radical SAM superfamily)